MPTNLEIDDRLLAKAQKAGGHKTKRATVNEALAEYIQHRQQREVTKLFGTVVFEPGFDHKAERAKR
ncbi:MAG TPA: type II toxin-antitoxin system VapB family antitoxin [Opitutaceae bacterium]|nr:type II toxin-antitoxin system VapB family antitoxin [Opitutaceae bacterium]